MDAIECQFVSQFVSEFKGQSLDDAFFVNYLQQSADRLKLCLELIRSGRNSSEEFESYFSLAIGSLQVFVFANWISVKRFELDGNIVNLLKEIDENDLKEELYLLNSDYQPPIRLPELLYLSKRILRNVSDDNLCFLIWKLRYLTVFQSVLNRSDNSFANDSNERLPTLIVQKLDDVDQRLRMRFLLEVCQHNLVQNKVQGLRELLVKANECTRLSIKLSGALGKRTQFQQQAKPLLFLNLTRAAVHQQANDQTDDQTGNQTGNQTNGSSNDGDVEMADLSAESTDDKLNKQRVDAPRDVHLTDDTLLNKPTFLNAVDQKVQLTDDEETLLLAIVKFGSKCGVQQDGLLKEELLTYLEYLIVHSTVWSVTFESMYQRSVLEQDERRKAERSMLQLSELIDKLNACQLTAGYTKMHLFYSALIAPLWKVKRNLANSLIRLGCIKEALDIYIELDLWEEVVFCYKQINRRDKAAEIIRQQIAIQETPYLLCLLGDATDQIDCYERAWQLSNGKSYLAQKRLGYHYYGLKDYKTAIECFRRSLELNCMQLDTLQRLGYSALLVEDYALAADAYRRVVECDLENFQAWNNLSKAYIKLGDKQRAFRTLQEALKNDYENSKIWQNLIVVAIDVGAYSEVIHAWNRLIDIDKKYEDDEIMNILVNELCTDDARLNGLRKRTLELLGRMTANFQCSSRLWLLYAKLLLHSGSGQNEERILNCLSKAQRALISKPGWEKNSEDVLSNLQALNQLHEYHGSVVAGIADEEARKRHSASFKLTANSMISLIKSKSEYWCKDEQAIRQRLSEFESKLVEIV